MSLEIEAKFLKIDINEMRLKLKAIGGELEHPMRLMRRDQFDHADERYKNVNYSERLRIRDEGDKSTITYKKTTADSNYSQEIETSVGSYEIAKRLLTAIGLHSFSYQESRRETWRVDDVEVVIDEWPWLTPYIEIEGPSEESIKAVSARLGFDWATAGFGSVDTAYMADYPKMTTQDTIGNVAEVRFDLPLPDYLKARL